MLWKSLMKPRRFAYTEDDLRGSFLCFDNDKYAKRLDFELINPLHEKFGISVYFPCNSTGDVSPLNEFVIYCHSHSGSRTEGLVLLEPLAQIGIGLVVFDFRANGYSSGEYCTLGFYESLDLNEVVRFMKQEAKAYHLAVWGRSMGAAAAIFFMSARFRLGLCQKVNNVQWAPRGWIDCLVLDSSFFSLQNAITNVVKHRSKAIPEFAINIARNVLNEEMKKRTNIDVSEVIPYEYCNELRLPICFYVGDNDEFVDLPSFWDMNRRIPAHVKKFRVYHNVTHNGDRNHLLISEATSFVRDFFDMRRKLIKVIQTTRSDIKPSLTSGVSSKYQTPFKNLEILMPAPGASLPLTPPNERSTPHRQITMPDNYVVPHETTFFKDLLRLQVPARPVPPLEPNLPRTTDTIATAFTNFFDEVIRQNQAMSSRPQSSIILPASGIENFFSSSFRTAPAQDVSGSGFFRNNSIPLVTAPNLKPATTESYFNLDEYKRAIGVSTQQPVSTTTSVFKPAFGPITGKSIVTHVFIPSDTHKEVPIFATEKITAPSNIKPVPSSISYPPRDYEESPKRYSGDSAYNSYKNFNSYRPNSTIPAPPRLSVQFSRLPAEHSSFANKNMYSSFYN